MMRNKTITAAGCVILLGVFVLFLEPAQYFFGDSIAVLWGRPHSAGSLVKDFVRLDGGHWYRPLSNSVPPFLLWPLFGMQFMPYHILALVLHGLFCIGLLEVFRRILKDDWAAFVGATFFAFHPIQFYATYDIAFYQEPITAALTVASLILLLRYIERPRAIVLIAGLLTFVAALSSKETSVMMPLLLVLLLFNVKELYKLPPARNAVLCAGCISAAFTLIYTFVLGVTFRYQPTYQPQLTLNAATDAFRAVLWSFGIPSGVQTQDWHYPPAMTFGLALLFSVTVAAAIAGSRNRAWAGFAWFFAAAGPAFFTQHLLPHHLYLALVGIAYSVGQTVAWLRSQDISRSAFRRAAYALGSLAIGLSFGAGYLDARADSRLSWVGESSTRVQRTADFFLSSKIDLSRYPGIVAVIGDAQVLRFDWMGGAFFNMIGGDDLETRIVDSEPESLPEGFQAVKWTGNSLKRLERVSENTSTEHNPVTPITFQITANRVYAGRDSYCLSVPYLAGQTIDVKYHYNERPASVAYSFAQLDSHGTACINVGASVPWGNIKVVGVRPSGSPHWYEANAEIYVLPPLFPW